MANDSLPGQNTRPIVESAIRGEPRSCISFACFVPSCLKIFNREVAKDAKKKIRIQVFGFPWRSWRLGGSIEFPVLAYLGVIKIGLGTARLMSAFWRPIISVAGW